MQIPNVLILSIDILAALNLAETLELFLEAFNIQRDYSVLFLQRRTGQLKQPKTCTSPWRFSCASHTGDVSWDHKGTHLALPCWASASPELEKTIQEAPVNPTKTKFQPRCTTGRWYFGAANVRCEDCAVLKVKKLSFDQSGTTVTMATLRYSKNKKKKKKPPQTQRNQNKLPNHLHLASMLIYLKQASFIRGTQH